MALSGSSITAMPQSGASRRQGTISNYTDPTIDGPIWIAAGSDGALWFSNQTNSSIGRITTSVTPEIKSFTPGSGPVGQKVTLTGKNLGGATAAAVNGKAAKDRFGLGHPGRDQGQGGFYHGSHHGDDARRYGDLGFELHRLLICTTTTLDPTERFAPVGMPYRVGGFPRGH